MIVKLKAVNKKTLPKDKGLKKAISDWNKKNGNTLAGMAIVIGGILSTGALLGSAIMLSETKNKPAVEQTIKDFKSICTFYDVDEQATEQLFKDTLQNYNSQEIKQGNMTHSVKTKKDSKSRRIKNQNPKSK